MSYGYFTQGTVIEGVRSKRYPDVSCYGVVITARCDISNCKVAKIYYLTALSVCDWLETEGVFSLAEKKLLSAFDVIEKNFGEKIPFLSRYRNASFINVDRIIQRISELPDGKEKATVLHQLEGIKKYAHPEKHIDNLRTELRKKVLEKLKTGIFDDKETHYCYIPQMAYPRHRDDPKIHHDGIIVNLLDVNYWTMDVVDKIEQQEMAFDRLKEDERGLYGESFVIEKEGDMIYPEREIVSPYVEYLMQAFSFAFIRIGIEFDRQLAKSHWDTTTSRVNSVQE